MDSELYNLITKNRKDYADYQGYEFVDYSDLVDDKKHWNWNEWAFIAAVIEIIQEDSDTWIMYGTEKLTIANYKNDIQDYINKHTPNDESIICTHLNQNVGKDDYHYWFQNGRKDLTEMIQFPGIIHKTIIPNYPLVVKCTKEIKEFLLTIYNDDRFNRDPFSEERCTKSKHSWIINGSHIPGTAFTIYWESFPEYRHLFSILHTGDVVSNLANDDGESYKEFLKDFDSSREDGDDLIYKKDDFMTGPACTQALPLKKMKEIIND